MKIEVKNVSKKFKNNTVLSDINMVFESGHIYGFIGRNGSGKSVLLKMLCGFYHPTSGEILFDNDNIIGNGKMAPNTRALIETPSFLPNITGYENLVLLASIQKRIGKHEILDTMDRLGLTEVKNKPYHTYSLGMKQKLGIVQVLMENPDVMILDEPFNGVEEITVSDIKDILLEEKTKGKIIIISSHIREDIESLADFIYVFDGGNVRVKKK